jgi:hypothetical protein
MGVGAGLAPARIRKDILVMDIIFIGLTVFFAVVTWAFIVLCSKV